MCRRGVNAALHIRRVSRKQWFFLQLSTSKHDFRSYINKAPDRESTKVWVFSWACAWSTYNTVRKLRELFHGGQYIHVCDFWKLFWKNCDFKTFFVMFEIYCKWCNRNIRNYLMEIMALILEKFGKSNTM